MVCFPPRSVSERRSIFIFSAVIILQRSCLWPCWFLELHHYWILMFFCAIESEQLGAHLFLSCCFTRHLTPSVPELFQQLWVPECPGLHIIYTIKYCLFESHFLNQIWPKFPSCRKIPRPDHCYFKGVWTVPFFSWCRLSFSGLLWELV